MYAIHRLAYLLANLDIAIDMLKKADACEGAEVLHSMRHKTITPVPTLPTHTHTIPIPRSNYPITATLPFDKKNNLSCTTDIIVIQRH